MELFSDARTHALPTALPELRLLAAEAASRMRGQVSGLVLYAVMAENMRDVFRFIITEGAFLPYRGTTPVFRLIGPLSSR